MANYTIDININSLQGEQEVFAGEQKAPNENNGLSNFDKGLKTFVASQVVKPFISQTINFAKSNVQLMTGSSTFQDVVNAGMQGVQVLNSIISTTSAGFSFGGPVGAGIGAVIGVAMAGLEVGFNQLQIGINEKIEDRQIQYMVNRIGPAFNNSRRGV